MEETRYCLKCNKETQTQACECGQATVTKKLYDFTKWKEQQLSQEPIRFFPNGKLNVKLLGDTVLSFIKVKTFKDNHDAYFYDDEVGVWKPAEEKIEELTKHLLKDQIRKNSVSEVLNYIRISTYQDRDQEPPLNIIPLKNCDYDLNTGETKPPSSEYFFLFRHPINYDAKATSENFEHMLEAMFDTQEERTVAKEVLAYPFYRAYSIQKAVMCIGSGSEGKSVFLGIGRSLYGKDAVASISLQDFSNNRFGKAELYQKAANICADLSSNSVKDTGSFKMLTGGDNISAERKNKNPFYFVNFAKLMFSCNELPKTTDLTPAYFRRWLIIKFTKVFGDVDDMEADYVRDTKLTQKLDAELSGVFNSVIATLKPLIERGEFTASKGTNDIMSEYIALSDNILAFCQDCLVEARDSWLSTQSIEDAYRVYCADNDVVAYDKPALIKKVRRFFPRCTKYEPLDDNGKRIHSLKGINFKDKFAKEPEPEKPKPPVDGGLGRFIDASLPQHSVSQRPDADGVEGAGGLTPSSLSDNEGD